MSLVAETTTCELLEEQLAQRILLLDGAMGTMVMAAGLVPILEPEVDIHCPDKAEAEKILKDGIMAGLAKLTSDQTVMLKLTLPEQDNFYRDCIQHANVLKVVALSGGYSWMLRAAVTSARRTVGRCFCTDSRSSLSSRSTSWVSPV